MYFIILDLCLGRFVYIYDSDIFQCSLCIWMHVYDFYTLLYVYIYIYIRVVFE